MGLWRSHEAQAATGGQATREWGCLGLSADLAHLAPGELFIAFDPEQARAAFDAGAGAVMAVRLGRETTVADPYLIVPDLPEALMALGAFARARMGARVVAIAGSLGKSTALSMAVAVLGRLARVETVEAATPLGLMMRLAHLGPQGFAPLRLRTGSQTGSQTGATPGAQSAQEQLRPLLLVEIDPAAGTEALALLELLQPDLLFVTASGMGALPQGLAPERMLLPAETTETVPQGAKLYGMAAACDPRLISSRQAQEVTVIEALHHGVPLLMKVRHPAPQIGMIALGVLALSVEAGADVAVAALDLGQWEAPEGQGLRERIYMDYVDASASFDLFDVTDEHNSTIAALTSDLATLAAAHPRDGAGKLRRGRRIAVLGGAEPLPAALAQAAVLRRIDRVHCFGAGGAVLHAALPETRRGLLAPDAKGLCTRAANLIDAGDVVMVRAREGSGADQIVAALRRLGQPGAAEAHGA